MLIKACHLNIEAGRKILQNGRQLFIVPLAADFVQRQIQGLFVLKGQLHHTDIHFHRAGRHQHFQALVTTNHVARLLVPDDRLNTAVFFDRPGNLLIFRVAGLQILSRIVGCCIEQADRYFSDFHELLLMMTCFQTAPAANRG